MTRVHGRMAIEAARVGGIAAIVLLVSLAASGSPRAQVQAPMNEDRCKALMEIVGGITMEFAGQISTDFIGDLQRKIGMDGKCDGPDEYRIWPNTRDREALGRIRQLLTAWDICNKEPAREECKQ
jgi:hypothetical protein